MRKRLVGTPVRLVVNPSLLQQVLLVGSVSEEEDAFRVRVTLEITMQTKAEGKEWRKCHLTLGRTARAPENYDSTEAWPAQAFSGIRVMDASSVK